MIGEKHPKPVRHETSNGLGQTRHSHGVHPAERFIHQQEAWFCGQASRDLEPATLAS
jgi:hypothetical protein